MNILLIGFGFVGKATFLFKNKYINIFIYDINADLCEPKDINVMDLLNNKNIDMIFICLPTPMNIDGTCNTTIIESTLKNIKHDYIIIRSTVPIGFCDNNNVFFMPEFLTEKNWVNDFKNNENWICGIPNNCDNIRKNNFISKINELINNAYDNNCIKYNNIIYFNNKEAELLKYIKNTFLSTKLTYFNEIYDLCNKLNINYNNVIECVKLDSRIGSTHIDVPGHDNKRGYGGTCFPKDTLSLYYQLNNNDVNSNILEANLIRNETIDRSERDWLYNINRAVTITQNKIALVTGGAGFIGSHLCKYLLGHQYLVICVDNLISGNMKNIQELMDNNNFKFLKFDITKKLFIPKIDEIYHLACMASPDKYKAYPIETLNTSILGIINVLELCKQHKCKLLFTSTSEVYGDPLIHPQPETYYGNVNTVGERSCYDEGKRVAETYIYEYRKKYNINAKIVRLFNTYGSNMDLNDGRVITNFIKCIKENKPFKIYGDGSQTRSFCYIDDMIDGLIKMMNSDEYGPINLGNPNCEFTLNQLADLFDEIFETKSERMYLKMTENDPMKRRPDITKAINKLNWIPHIDIEEGIKLIYDSFK